MRSNAQKTETENTLKCFQKMMGVLGDRYRYGCHLDFFGDGAEILAQSQMLNSFRTQGL